MTNALARPLAPIPGLFLAAVMASVALWIADLPLLRDTLHISALLIVILLGMVIASVVKIPEAVMPGVQVAQRPILRWAVAGLGLKLSLQEILHLGGSALAVVVLGTLSALWFGFWISKQLGIPRKLGLLLGVGGAICGASAIVAADSVVMSEKRDSAVALGTITLLGTIGIIVYPQIGIAIGLTDQLYGLWNGASLHEMAQVVAAGFGVSEEAARISTVVKLARITMLAPVVFWLAWTMRRHHEATGKAKVSVLPWFLVAFLFFAAINSLNVLPQSTIRLLSRIDLWLLCVGMAGVGLQTGFGDLRKAGPLPILAGALQWMFLSLLALIMAVWLNT